MQDEFGRPLSDDGQWVWDGSVWQPTGRGGAGPAGGQGGGGTGLEPTQVAPSDYQPTGGLPPQQPAQQVGYPYPTGGPPGPGPYGPGQHGQFGPGAPGRPPGSSGPPPPFYKRPVVIIGALLVLSAVLVTVILLTRGGDDNSAGPGPSIQPTAVPTAAPSTQPTTEEPTEPPTTAPPTDTLPSDEITPGMYNCTSGGSPIGTVTFTGTDYTTSSGATGSYQYDESTGDISFTGGDLGPYSGTYDPSGPSMDLTTTSGGDLTCAQ